MINAPTHAVSAEVTAIDTQARNPLLLLIGSGIAWLVLSGIFAIITSIQLHSPAFLDSCAWLTHGRAQALRETMFVYGWAANAGLGLALWVLGRLGGYPLRALNWVIVGTLFWNLGVTAGLVGIAVGDMTSFSLLQMPRYVQPLLAFAYAAIGISGILAWGGRRTEGTYASHWYGVAALLLFPWMIVAAQAVLLWWPVRGTVQAIAAGWYAQGVWTLWLAPLALTVAYYVVPKVSGRLLPTYDSAPLAFWTLIYVGAWTGGRHLIGGPAPAWVSTMATVSLSLLAFHYIVVALNFRVMFGAKGTAIKFIRFGILAYLLVGLLEIVMSFRGVAVQTQFTLMSTAVEQLGLYGAISMIFFGGIYYMLPRVTGHAWASSGLASGHRVLAIVGVLVLVIALAVAGSTQGSALLDANVALGEILSRMRGSLMAATAAHVILLTANLLLLVNFCRTACVCMSGARSTVPLFQQPATLEAHAS